MHARHLAVVCAALVAAVLALPASAAAKSCDLRGKERKLGPTYVTSLTVSGVSCPAGEGVVKAFHRCRYSSGGKKGRCARKVMGYSCSEKRGQAIPTQYDATVTCKRGSKRVVHRYTQYT